MDLGFTKHRDQMKPVVSQEKNPIYSLSTMIIQALEGQYQVLFHT
jgi:hypothetical protein